MDVFDQPPATPPVSFEPPQPPRRGSRPVVIGAAAALLVGGGIVGIAQLVDADRPETSTARLLAATPDEPVDDPDDEPAPDDVDEPARDEPDEPAEPDGDAEVDGEIVIDVGGDEPIVIEFDDESLGRLRECLPIDISFDVAPIEPGEVPSVGDLPFPDLFEDLLDENGRLRPGALDELFEGGLFEDGPFGEWRGDVVWGPPIDLDGRVTVVTDDGVTIVDLGEGDGSVTITREGGEIEITTDGDATVHEPGEWIAELDEWAEGSPPRIPPRWDEWLDGDELPAIDELPALDELFGELPDLDELRECIADALAE